MSIVTLVALSKLTLLGELTPREFDVLLQFEDELSVPVQSEVVRIDEWSKRVDCRRFADSQIRIPKHDGGNAVGGHT